MYICFMATALLLDIKESKENLKKLLKKQPEHLRDRIRMLLVIKLSSEALNKNALAEKVGVNHNSIQWWRTLYRKGGLSKLLEYNRGGYKKPLITPEVHQKLKERLHNPHQAFRSYEELRSWIDEQFIPGINYHTVNKYVKRHFGTKLKVARKSHIDKDEKAVEVFKKTSRITGRRSTK